jgi:DNA (cytosine-5)-methyltransferase 1
MTRPRLLDLFCGAGGAAVGYHRAGFDVTGVDIEPQPHYPFDFHQADALTFPLDGFDVVHASPPCQRWSTSTKRWNGRAGLHPDLIEPTRVLLRSLGVPYVIENVPGAPLITPVRLCGSSFGLGVRRHRLFETSFPLLVPPCAHGTQPPRYRVYAHGRWYLSPVAPVYGHGDGKAGDAWGEAMQIGGMTRAELAQAIPPAYTEHIGRQLLALLDA